MIPAALQRWLGADPTHSIVRLNSLPPAPSKDAVVPDLQTLAQHELSIAGRYQIPDVAPPMAGPWWLQVLHRIHEWWQHLWQAVFGHVHTGGEAAASIGDVLLAIVGLLLIFVAVRLLMNLRLARSAQTFSAPLQEPPAPRALYRQASNAAGRGDYGSAALLLYAATVALLDRRGAIDGGQSATVGDLRRELRVRNAMLVASFDAIAASFVQRAYAERAVDESQWDRARAAFERLISSPASFAER